MPTLTRLLLCITLLGFLQVDGYAQSSQEVPKVPTQIQSDQQEQSEDGKKSDKKQPEPAAETQESGEAENDKAKSDSKTRRSGKRSRKSKRGYSKRSEQFVSVFEPVVGSTSSSIVRISNGKKQTALGTIVSADGLILTKASELKGSVRCQMPDGTRLKPEIVGIDPKTDLVLLQVEAEGLNFARLEELDPTEQPQVGSWLATVGQNEQPLTVGIVSHEPREIASLKLNSAVIGIFPEDREDGDGVRINVVLNDTPAEEAGLLVNDVITAIDGEQILSRAELMETLSHFQPGDEIVLTILRDEEELEVPVTLGKRRVNPMMDRGNRQNRMGSTLSRRRSDFPLALQHDSTLNADEIGSPVVDLDGRIVGINIARDGRVSSLALPIEIVLPVVTRLKTGKFKPAVVNRQEIRQLEKMLSRLDREMEDLPETKKQEIEFGAGSAVEEELELQIKQAKKRLDDLQKRLAEKKKSNKAIAKKITDVGNSRSRIERKREPLLKQLNQLKTGIE